MLSRCYLPQAFQGRHGRAFLFSNVCVVGAREQRTPLHPCPACVPARAPDRTTKQPPAPLPQCERFAWP